MQSKFCLSTAIALSCTLAGNLVVAQTAPLVDGVIFKQAEERQRQIQEDNRPQGFAGLEFQAPELTPAVVPEGVDENACIAQQTMIFASAEPSLLRYLDKAAKQQGLNQLSGQQWQAGTGQNCLRVRDVVDVSSAAQNALIADGWITSRILLEQDDTQKAPLKLIVSAGKIAHVRENRDEIGRVPHSFNFIEGNPLNLRDIEQSLDNLQQLRSVQANIDIAPAEQEGYSDLIVHWQKSGRPYQLSFLVDDSGSKALGKYLGTMSAWIDNPLNLNDSLYASYTRNLKSGKQLQDDTGKHHKSSTDSYYAGYNLAHRNWAFNFAASQHHYDQLVPGYSKIYHYEGKSQKLEWGVANTIYRDQTKKTVLTGGLWWRKNQNFINDTEIAVQRKQSAGWRLGVKQTFHFPQGMLEGGLDYQRGTRMFGAIPAAEEAFNEGTTKVSIWRADVDWHMPLFNGKSLWHSDFHLQYADKPLTSTDLISLGGRNTIRGFTENNTVSGDSGWYWRNTVDWRYRPNHQLYTGADMGQVWGQSTRYLSDTFMAGVVVGAKGHADFYGNWQYDIFAGIPLTEADHWQKKDRFVVGFSAGYRW